jgi:hypothetical protein
MEITKQTNELLENLSMINKNFLFNKGKVQRTLNKSKSFMAEVIFDNEIPVEAGIYDLVKVVSGMKTLPNPSLSFAENSLSVIGQDSEMIFAFTDKSLLDTPKKSISEYSYEFEYSFDLSLDKFEQIIKYFKVMNRADHKGSKNKTKSTSFNFLIFEGNGQEIIAQVQESRNLANNVLRIKVGNSDQVFKFMIDLEQLKLLKDDYTVELSNKKLCKFSCKNIKASYLIAVENTI